MLNLDAKLLVLIAIVLIGMTLHLTGNMDLTQMISSQNAQYDNKKMSDDEVTEYVDNQLHELMVSESFESADEETRVTYVKALLKKLKKEKRIKNYFYSTETQMFSFEYKDGSLGGVVIKEHDPLMNSID